MAMFVGLHLHSQSKCEPMFCQVKCINSENGCPLLLLRSQLGSHLQRCPASVVYCTMEWNRWPVYSRERQSRVPFVTDNIHARNGQLDVALALRDQRMLNEAMKAPRSVRRVLRNNLTQRFPAVPIRHGSCKLPDIESSNTSRTVSDDEGDVSQRQKHTKSPKDQSLNQELLDATRTAAGRLSEAIQVVLDNENNPSVELGAALPVTGHQCSSAAEEMLSQDLNGRHDVSMDTSDEQLIEELPRIVEVKSSPKDGVRPITNHENDVDNWSASSVDNVIKTLQENDTRYNLYINVVGLDLSQPKEADSSKDEGVVTSYKLPAVEVPIPPPPPLNTKDALSLDLNLESITRYQAKPRSMYTFLCAQEFRRDEYSSHFKNVHDDIHGGLNGWLEQRCPLAHYGCNYSLRRLHPKESGAHVVHNRALESFGVRPFLPEYQQDQESSTNGNFFVPSSTDVEIRESDVSPDDNAAVSVNGNCEQCHDKSSDNMDVSTSPGYLSNTSHENSRCQRNLMQLPFEVLRHVCTFLDGYSMCNIALTCHLLREVACSLLEEKGIVIQQWARMQVNNKNHWYISYKVS